MQRYEPSGLNTITYSSSYQSTNETIYDTAVKDLYIKENYLFTSKTNSKSVSNLICIHKTSKLLYILQGKLELYVSYKLNRQLPCVFDSELDMKGFLIVDVSANRAVVAVSHSDTLSHLYVSDDLSGTNGQVHFTLSLESAFCYFPNITWHMSFLK